MLFSIIILTFNQEKQIGKLLNRLDTMSKKFNREIIVLVTESTDGTLVKAKKFSEKIKNAKVYEIKKKDFNHSKTRNFGVSLAKGKYVCFVSGDALPKVKHSFDYFLEDLKLDKKVVAVYTKDTPYRNTPFIQKLEVLCRYEQLDKYTNKKGVLIQNLKKPFLPYTSENKFLWYVLSNVFACYKRRFLINHPFSKTNYGEDVLMGKYIIKNGFTKIYDKRCKVIHSHIYTPYEYYKRQKEDFSLRYSRLKFRGKGLIPCKIKKILALNIPFTKKSYYLIQLLFYYLIKLIALAHARVS
ncbi:glycosyltransferase family 2 protein [Patescibacteria group bacterium]|nr:glycosyltransferase family 2 protein [Patescibacteria group bacterium]MBU0777230.1 glycosyltransferase family 2 protein [Patescibacteria group bacterium]MBU0845925.1 glycosyltransferase family 2 protein [Patescibacteria group bacterium]MBU0922953.1 glycosyltransferase family 2 protein [Patescibacteria group bacterium]MBU1066197.1 glycosyltransferase family 2 protein [Patescibacteria group bacterium]